MGGGDWEKEQSSVSLMPDSALCAEDRLSKVMLKRNNIHKATNLRLLEFTSTRGLMNEDFNT